MLGALTLRWHQKYQASHESHRSQWMQSGENTPKERLTRHCNLPHYTLTIQRRKGITSLLNLFLAGLEGVVYTCG